MGGGKGTFSIYVRHEACIPYILSRASHSPRWSQLSLFSQRSHISFLPLGERETKKQAKMLQSPDAGSRGWEVGGGGWEG